MSLKCGWTEVQTPVILSSRGGGLFPTYHTAPLRRGSGAPEEQWPHGGTGKGYYLIDHQDLGKNLGQVASWLPCFPKTKASILAFLKPGRGDTAPDHNWGSMYNSSCISTQPRYFWAAKIWIRQKIHQHSQFTFLLHFRKVCSISVKF